MKKSRLLALLYVVIVVLAMASCCKSTKPDQVEAPTFNPPGGSYVEEQSVTLSCATQGATIVYTLNGSEPNLNSPRYSEPILISENKTIKAKAFKTDMQDSKTASSTYTINLYVVATPIISVSGGTYNSIQTVSISCDTQGASIYYSTDGSDPDESSRLYSTPIRIYTDTILKARAFKTLWLPSRIAQAEYDIRLSEFVHVSSGTFHNGSSDVSVSSFYIGRYELTQAEYQAVMGNNPAHFGDNPNHPVEQVSWFDAIEYCNRRSLQEDFRPCYSYGNYGTNPDNWPSGWNSSDNYHTNVSCDWSADGYRLPTEMEWMFAAKGGNESRGYIYSGSNNYDDVVWCYENSGATTHKVGTKLPNELEIFDMNGNVWEFCWDIYAENYPSSPQINPHGPDSGNYRATRGACWTYGAQYCTIAYRFYDYPTARRNYIGFRICRISP